MTTEAPDRYCSQCGAELSASARFCAQCGRSIGPKPTSPPRRRDFAIGASVVALLVAGIVFGSLASRQMGSRTTASAGGPGAATMSSTSKPTAAPVRTTPVPLPSPGSDLAQTAAALLAHLHPAKLAQIAPQLAGYPFEAYRHDASFARALDAVATAARKTDRGRDQQWIDKAGGVQTPMDALSDEAGRTYVLFDACRPHDCPDGRFYGFYDPKAKRAAAVLYTSADRGMRAGDVVMAQPADLPMIEVLRVAAKGETFPPSPARQSAMSRLLGVQPVATQAPQADAQTRFPVGFVPDSSQPDAQAPAPQAKPYLTRRYAVGGGRGGYDASCDTDTIESKSDDGSILKMLSGTVYHVSDVDTVTTSIWLESDDVTICEDGAEYKIIDDGETAYAQKIDE